MPDIQLLTRRQRSMIRYPGTSTLSAVAVAIMRGHWELSDEAGDARYDGDRPATHDAQPSCLIRKLRRKGGVTSEFGRVVSIIVRRLIVMKNDNKGWILSLLGYMPLY